MEREAALPGVGLRSLLLHPLKPFVWRIAPEQCHISLHHALLWLLVSPAHVLRAAVMTVLHILLISFFFPFRCYLSPSLKQCGIHTGNPWPPYKERTPLHPCYKGLIKLLHCKTLHIVIFTLLYKVRLSMAALNFLQDFFVI